MTSPFRLGLFALTGFGNPVLRALHSCGMSPVVVVTRQELKAYPYYQERQLSEEAMKLGIPVLFGKEGEDLCMAEPPDVLIVASYHRIVPPAVFKAAKRAYNIHPSLLPRNRGASPCFWTLLEGASKAGVTVHELTEEVDCGDIVWQQAVEIAVNETQGTLRKKLAEVFGVAVIELVELLSRNHIELRQQDSRLSSWQPKLRSEDRVLDLNMDPHIIERKFRALSPFPGALYNGQIVRDVTIMDDRLAGSDHKHQQEMDSIGPGLEKKFHITSSGVKIALSLESARK